MYLSDKDLAEKWQEIYIECDNSNCDTECNKNIQPCSADLCLSNIFWEPLKHKPIDLRKSVLLEIAPRRYWKKRTLRKNEYITLKPGKLLLGRIAAKIAIPDDCAGKIEGRSSFSRMGLGVHCTGDFINPGYRGHMPLELYNYSPNAIKLFPYIPICQLKLIKLTQAPEKKYGLEELQSKYMDDDGGPSYWWRDKRIKSLQETFTLKSVELFIQERLFEKIGVQEPEIIERFEKLIEKRQGINNENAETLLEEFSRSEDKLRFKDKLLKGFSTIIFPAFLSASIGVVFIDGNSLIRYIIWGLNVLAVIPFIWAIRDSPKQYLGEK